MAVRRAVDVPVLRKDFIVSSYQLLGGPGRTAPTWRCSSWRRSSRTRWSSLVERAKSLGLTPLVECHTVDEVARAVDAGADVVGVNARDLRTLAGRPRRSSPRSRRTSPSDVVRIAESGVRGPHDVIEYARAGADAVLVGESLVTGRDPRSAVADLVAAGAHPALKHDR